MATMMARSTMSPQTAPNSQLKFAIASQNSANGRLMALSEKEDEAISGPTRPSRCAEPGLTSHQKTCRRGIFCTMQKFTLIRRSFGWAGLNRSLRRYARNSGRLPWQNKKQREGLAPLVATALHVRGVNLNELAAALARKAERHDMRYQWISRVLGVTLHSIVRMRQFGRVAAAYLRTVWPEKRSVTALLAACLEPAFAGGASPTRRCCGCTP